LLAAMHHHMVAWVGGCHGVRTGDVVELQQMGPVHRERETADTSK
jgi:hypothetical protein